MSEPPKTSALVEILASLTISRVALGLALAAGGVILWGQYSDSTKANPVLLSAIGVGMLSLAVGAGMWGKLEAAQKVVADQAARTVEELKITVAELRTTVREMQVRLDMGAEDRADLRAQLEACMARDRAMQQRFVRLDKRLDETDAHRASGFGDIEGAG